MQKAFSLLYSTVPFFVIHCQHYFSKLHLRTCSGASELCPVVPPIESIGIKTKKVEFAVKEEGPNFSFR